MNKDQNPDYYDVDRYHKQAQQRTKKQVIKTLITVLAITLVTIGSLTGGILLYAKHIDNKLHTGLQQPVPSTTGATSHTNVTDELVPVNPEEPFYMLLLGVDKYEERTNDTENYGPDNSAYRSDTILLARIDEINKQVTLVSIHRDTLVNLPNGTQGKINSAYSIGGAACATKVISEFADVPISHYAEIDLDGFAKIVDTLGGVDVDLPVPVSDPNYTGIDLPAGKQHLDGMTAALLCRCRHGYDAYGDGDRYRAANQRMVIASLAKTALSSDPLTLRDTVSAVADCVTTDISVADALNLALSLQGMDPTEDIMSGMEPTEGLFKDETWYEVCHQDEWKEMMQRVDNGLPPYKDGEQDSTAGIAGAS